MQAQPGSKYEFIVVHQDQLMTFVCFRSLYYKRAEDVSYALLNIFTTFGVLLVINQLFFKNYSF